MCNPQVLCSIGSIKKVSKAFLHSTILSNLTSEPWLSYANFFIKMGFSRFSVCNVKGRESYTWHYITHLIAMLNVSYTTSLKYNHPGSLSLNSIVEYHSIQQPNVTYVLVSTVWYWFYFLVYICHRFKAARDKNPRTVIIYVVFPSFLKFEKHLLVFKKRGLFSEILAKNFWNAVHQTMTISTLNMKAIPKGLHELMSQPQLLGCIVINCL